MRDWLTILTRLHWIWTRRFQFDPLPWARCHCGALAEIDMRIIVPGIGREPGIWCMPCKYAAHDTCECSRDEDTNA